MTHVMAALAIVSGLALSACATPPTATLVVGVQSVKPDETRAAWTPLVQDIGRRLDARAEVMTATQSEVVNALREARVDVAWLSSSAAIDAVADAGAEVFAVYRNVNGQQGYRAVIVARAGNGIANLEQALMPARWRYASGPRTSTSGYLLPQHFLFGPRGTTAETVFKTVQYAGHFANLDALWAGQVDLAVNNSTDLATFRTRQPAADAGLVVLWESPLVPNDVLLLRRGLAPAARQRLRDAFLGYGATPQEQALLRQASGIAAFVPADNRLLAPVAAFKFATERSASGADTAAVERRAHAFRDAVSRSMNTNTN